MGPWQPLDPIRPTSVIVVRPSLMAKSKENEDTSLPDSYNIGDNEFLYTDSKRSRIEKDKADKRLSFEQDLEMDSSDISLATLPGQSFDPKKRCFNIEELRPQPIIRKRKKTHVPEHEKNEKYWENRAKNTQATKRAREAKRLKENQIVLRTAFLETENERLTEELEKVAMERDCLIQKLATHEKQKLATLEKSQLSVKFNYLPSDAVNNSTYVDFDEFPTFCPITTAAAMCNSSTDIR